jgi:hypothetical protein
MMAESHPFVKVVSPRGIVLSCVLSDLLLCAIDCHCCDSVKTERKYYVHLNNGRSNYYSKVLHSILATYVLLLFNALDS